jgi:hypothetical protein
VADVVVVVVVATGDGFDAEAVRLLQDQQNGGNLTR